MAFVDPRTAQSMSRGEKQNVDFGHLDKQRASASEREQIERFGFPHCMCDVHQLQRTKWRSTLTPPVPLWPPRGRFDNTTRRDQRIQANLATTSSYCSVSLY